MGNSQSSCFPIASHEHGVNLGADSCDFCVDSLQTTVYDGSEECASAMLASFGM